jgi:hypothetical protein
MISGACSRVNALWLQSMMQTQLAIAGIAQCGHERAHRIDAGEGLSLSECLAVAIEDDLFAALVTELCDQSLRMAIAIHIGCVDKVHA